MRGDAFPKQVGLLAAPLLVGFVMVAAWSMGDSPAARVGNAALVWHVAGPLLVTGAAIRVAKTGDDRALVLPTPMMLWLAFSSARASTPPVILTVLAELAVLVLLYACWRQWRVLAQSAAACCGAVTIGMQLADGAGHLVRA